MAAGKKAKRRKNSSFVLLVNVLFTQILCCTYGMWQDHFLEGEVDPEYQLPLVHINHVSPQGKLFIVVKVHFTYTLLLIFCTCICQGGSDFAKDEILTNIKVENRRLTWFSSGRFLFVVGHKIQN
jgi:hypothetical protein